MNTAANKRKNKREQCLVPVDGKEDGPFASTQTIDISKEGIGFISKKKIAKNKQIAIELELDEEGDPVFVIGKVKWVRAIPDSESFRVGLHFDDILRGSKSRLYKYFKDM